MLAIPPDMPRAAPIRQDSGRPHVRHAVNGRTPTIMTHALPVASLTPEMAFTTAMAWGEQATSLTEAARACLAAADFLGDAAGHLLAAADSAPSEPIPEGVILLAAYRSRRQAVQR